MSGIRSKNKTLIINLKKEKKNTYVSRALFQTFFSCDN